MSPLGRYCLRASSVSAGVVLALALGAGLIRLLPWLVAPNVPLRVCLPFARALAAVAVETALLVGLPMGFAFGAALFVERGEARALMALGASPARLVGGVGPRLALAAAIGYLACAAWRPNLPGRFVAQLIERGRASCHDVARPTNHWVPLVNVTWLCFPGAPPRVVGPLPGAAGRYAWFSARDLKPNDNLTRVSLDDLALVARPRAHMPALSLRVAHARLTGLSSWGVPSRLPSPVRAALIVVTASLLALFSAWLIVGRGLQSRLLALALGGVSALAALSALHAIDRSGAGALSYLLVPAAGLSAAAALSALARRFARAGGKTPVPG